MTPARPCPRCGLYEWSESLRPDCQACRGVRTCVECEEEFPCDDVEARRPVCGECAGPLVTTTAAPTAGRESRDGGVTWYGAPPPEWWREIERSVEFYDLNDDDVRGWHEAERGEGGEA